MSSHPWHVAFVGTVLFAAMGCQQGSSIKSLSASTSTLESVTTQSDDQTSSDADNGADTATATASTASTSSSTSTAAATTVAELIEQCGVANSSLSDPTAILFDTTLYSWPKVFYGTSNNEFLGPVNYSVSLQVVLGIHATTGTTTETTGFNVTATPSEAQDQAESQVSPYGGTTTIQNLSINDRTALIQSQKDWNGIVCTVQPVQDMDVSKGGTTKHVTFNPPLPESISPLADAARYDAEIGASLSFSGITATISSSDDSTAPAGTQITGSVTIQQIDPRLTMQVGNTVEQQRIYADEAYTITWTFGDSTNDNLELGLPASESIYIDNTAHAIAAVVVDTGNPSIGTLVMGPNLQNAAGTATSVSQ